MNIHSRCVETFFGSVLKSSEFGILMKLLVADLSLRHDIQQTLQVVWQHLPPYKHNITVIKGGDI